MNRTDFGRFGFLRICIVVICPRYRFEVDHILICTLVSLIEKFLDEILLLSMKAYTQAF